MTEGELSGELRRLVQMAMEEGFREGVAAGFDVDRAARAFGIMNLGPSGVQADGSPWPADVDWAREFISEYSRLATRDRVASHG